LNLLTKFFSRTPRQSDPAPAIAAPGKLPVQLVDIILPTSDDAELTLLDAPGEAEYRKFILEPFFSMIEYTDSNGVTTRRRVTMRNIIDRGDHRYLQAYCHERNNMRSFRLDRVSCLISQDGEIEDAAEFFRDVLATAEVETLTKPVSIVTGPKVHIGNSPKASTVSPYTQARRHLTPAITLLTATARSDDILHPEEMNRILIFVEREGEIAWKGGLSPSCLSLDDLDKLERTIRRLRPTKEDIGEALTGLQSWPVDAMKRLARALAATAQADGKVDDIEADIIAELRSAGARDHGYGWDE